MPSRNTEINLSSLPALYTNRSRHHDKMNIKTTGNVGDLILFFNDELVQPGDTYNIILSMVARLNTPYQPVMDNAYYDTYLFAVDWLDIWDYTKEFWGENTTGSWRQLTEYETPKVKVESSATIGKHDLLAYMGFRQGQRSADYTVGGGLTINAYCFCWNEYFRDQNYTAPLTINKAGTTVTFNTSSAVTGGQVLKACKMHDRYTSGLPEPGGNTVGIPLGTSAPVYGNAEAIGLRYGTDSGAAYARGILNAELNRDGNVGTDLGLGTRSGSYPINGTYTDANPTASQLRGWNINDKTHGDSGVYADLAGAISATLSAQRVALALNHIEEKLGMYGRRYREIIRSCWYTDTSDKAMHIPSYIGGKRTMMNMNQVTATTNGTNQDLGSTGAFSLTTDVYELCNQSFTEHTVLIGVMCLRTEEHNGVQGMPRQYLKSKKYDYYWDELGGLGFQPVYNGELFWQASSEDMEAHHFLPAWEEYRRFQDRLTGEFNPDYSNWLGQWTYASKLTSLPAMGTDWLTQNSNNMDRTLIETSSLTDNYIVDIELDITKYSIVKQYGLPGMDKF